MAADLTLYQEPLKNTPLLANNIHYHYIVNIHHYVDNCDFFSVIGLSPILSGVCTASYRQ